MGTEKGDERKEAQGGLKGRGGLARKRREQEK